MIPSRFLNEPGFYVLNISTPTRFHLETSKRRFVFNREFFSDFVIFK